MQHEKLIAMLLMAVSVVLAVLSPFLNQKKARSTAVFWLALVLQLVATVVLALGLRKQAEKKGKSLEDSKLLGGSLAVLIVSVVVLYSFGRTGKEGMGALVSSLLVLAWNIYLLRQLKS